MTDQSIVAGMRRVQPVIIAFAIFSRIIAGTIALRGAIGLPVYYRH
jgi:hypothetical protein